MRLSNHQHRAPSLIRENDAGLEGLTPFPLWIERGKNFKSLVLDPLNIMHEEEQILNLPYQLMFNQETGLIRDLKVIADDEHTLYQHIEFNESGLPVAVTDFSAFFGIKKGGKEVAVEAAVKLYKNFDEHFYVIHNNRIVII